MVGRIWHGWTTPDRADASERLLREEIFPGIEARGVAGYLGIDLLRRTTSPTEVELMTIMWFDSPQALREFAGEDTERAYVPSSARAVLARFDERARHYEVWARVRGAARQTEPETRSAPSSREGER